MKIRHLLGATLLTGLALAASTPAGPAWSATPAATPAAGPRDQVDFTLPDMKGNMVSLAPFLGQKPVLLVFWATWCPHCNGAVPDINRIHAESGNGDRLQVLALDYKESEAKVASFIRRKKVAYPVLLDERGEVARRYKILGIPTYILIDEAGRIVYRDHEIPEIPRFLVPSPRTDVDRGCSSVPGKEPVSPCRENADRQGARRTGSCPAHGFSPFTSGPASRTVTSCAFMSACASRTPSTCITASRAAAGVPPQTTPGVGSR